MKFISFLIICSMLLFTTCKKNNETSQSPVCNTCASCPTSVNSPAIVFHSFRQHQHDSLFVKINFCDRDGDIGYTDNSQIRNLMAVYYYKDSTGSWVTVDLPSTPQHDTLIYEWTIPILPDPPVYSAYYYGNDVTPLLIELNSSLILQGNIEIKFIAPYSGLLHHEIKFEIFMYDRAMNISNKIFTPSIFP